MRETIQEAFKPVGGLERRFFPEEPSDIPDAPVLTLVVLAPEHSWEEASRDSTRRLVDGVIRECGGRGRTFKSALIFAVPESGAVLADEAKTVLALEGLEDPAEMERLKLDSSQMQELREKKHRTERNLREGVWRAYRRLLLLGEKDELREVDLGLIHPSAAESLTGLIVSRLKQEGLLEETVSPDFLVRNFPPALEDKGWDTKSVRDTFSASPAFPRLLYPDVLKETIAQGVRAGKFTYARKTCDGTVEPVSGKKDFSDKDVEFSEDIVLLLPGKVLPRGPIPVPPPPPPALPSVPSPKHLSWSGDLPHNKWMLFYNRVLTFFARCPNLRVSVTFEVSPDEGISETRHEEIKQALQDLGLNTANLRLEKKDT